MSFWLSQELLISTLLVLLVPLGLYLYLWSSRSRSRNPASLPTNWPIMHMFPSFIANIHNLHDYLTIVLAGSGHNFRAHGPPGSRMRLFITCEPANARHIFATNYTNFPKGAEFAAIFDIMGESLFNIDGAPSLRQRAIIQTVLSSPRLVASMEECCRNKVENGLLPFFSHMASTNTPFNLQELMSRFMFDLAATSVFGVDPGLLSAEMPSMDVAVAMETVMEVGFSRVMMPASCWKAMRWLNIGQEKKLRMAHIILREFVAKMMEWRSINKANVCNDEGQEGVDILSCMNNPDIADYDLLRDYDLLGAALIGLMLATRDTILTTLTWTFYNLAQNSDVVSTIRNELSPIASCKASTDAGALVIFGPKEVKYLVYLQATMYETLRLYPPVPLERKIVASDDIMPSGHEVHAGDTILISIHAMGRMETVWGKDCLDYKPSRWLSKDGNTLKYVPSHKFLAFNAGPRICPGKNIAVMEMKTIIAAAVWNFDMELVEGQNILPKPSCIMSMKNGLMVKLKKREM